ncbi:MAG TPA: lipid-A-disaccharide synthase [Candidatus Aquicultoraceae bacterium]|nr:lipid-A-disaccharide synthase [Candidatus Aquicultoraceae bacterium]
MRATAKTLVILCGEPSGETYAVQAARAFRRRFPGVPMEGIGGARLAGEGVRLLMEYGEISVVGLTEVIRHVPAIARALRLAVRRATSPDVGALLLVDFPEFNFRVGKRANARGVPVVYYVPPQLWAWREGRARELARFTKGVVVPFPFEEPLLRKHGVNARFAGHPLLEELRPWLDRSADPERFGIPKGRRIVGLLPGSRPGEIRRHFPAMVEAARTIARRFPDVHFVVPLASPAFREGIAAMLSGDSFPVAIVGNDRYLLFRGMTTALSASGTATLELALLGVPPVIVYRMSPATYRIGRMLASVSCIGLPNIVAGKRFLPELVQDECRPERMAGEIGDLLSDGARKEDAAETCRSLRKVLEGTGPAEAVAEMLAAAGEGWP